ncbi:hypothetical protein JZ751_005770 [Albula glossodonta]|uniref:Sema domain-containing protein n=1 Tax=Albula glossodonta TaxID=121402 RepID=A0A8T2N512_9TELE|nr:hypothetical protein JZ751_005770 [Albula glossodonta]
MKHVRVAARCASADTDIRCASSPACVPRAVSLSSLTASPSLPPASMAPLMPKWHLLVLLGLLDSCKTQLVPRSTFAIGSPGRAVTHFSSPGIENTTTLLLSNDNTTLYVGARDSVLSLDVSEPGVMKLRSKVDWSPTAQEVNLCTTKGKNKMDCHNFVRVLQSLNSTHLYACGTFAFSPKCSYMNVETFSDSSVRAQDGQGRCPFDPFHRNTAVTADGELYVGTVENFLGNKPAISRFLSRRGRTDLKLDGSPGWLTDPTFVGSSFIPSEGKVYFFFTETSKEYNFVNDYTVSRVAQVCVNDEGGKLVLQKHWTTFAKAELRCQAGKDLPLNIIQDIFTLPPAEGTPADDTLLYGVFSSQWPMVSGQSAVCRFKLGDIKEVFAGSYYKLNQQDSSRWETPQPSAKIANPGECGMHAAADDKLNFVRSNFLTQRSVTPVGKGPVLVSPDQLYSRIAALRTQAANGRNFTVLFLLTESGFLHKVVLLGKGPHIIEEIQVFQQPQSVKNILLSISKGVVFVASSEGMVQVPVSSCSSYSNCAECVLARDPFCGWDPDRASCVELSTILHGA